jgi:hypothetical protein
VWFVPLKQWRQIELDTSPMHDWLFNMEGSLEDSVGEGLLASIYSTTEWRTVIFGQQGTASFLRTDR